MIEPLSTPPEDRSIEQIDSLLKATSYLDFFAKINEKKLNQERRIHEKCVKKLLYGTSKKGEMVINHSNLLGFK